MPHKIKINYCSTSASKSVKVVTFVSCVCKSAFSLPAASQKSEFAGIDGY